MVCQMWSRAIRGRALPASIGVMELRSEGPAVSSSPTKVSHSITGQPVQFCRFHALTRAIARVTAYNRHMSSVIEQLTRSQFKVARTSSFVLERPDDELQRLAEAGAVLALAKGFYALIPEESRGPNTQWRPTIEGAALGMAASLHHIEEVALVGPSAARAHGCYPRALGAAYVSVPQQRRPRQTVLGTIRFVERPIDKMDTVRITTDLGQGWATSVEQTALDLSRNRPAWNVSDEAKAEMIRFLAARIDWELIDEIAEETRGVKTLRRLRKQLDQGTQ